MRAELLLSRRVTLSAHAFAEVVLWHVPQPVRGSRHVYKYRLALVVRGECVLRYDNEAGKGDHRHLGADETPYVFTGVDELIADFRADVEGWMDENGPV